MNEEANTEQPQEEVEEVSTVHVPDIPLPSERGQAEGEPHDSFKGAYRLAIVGAGQGGSRLAETFWKLGYRRVCVVNTAKQDMAAIDIPEDRKLLIGEEGAGKNIKVAQKLAQDRYEDILDFLRRGFKGGYDRLLICVGAGGGTGAGSIGVLLNVAHALSITLGIEGDKHDGKVGVLVALPTRAEGKKVNANASKTLKGLLKATIEKKLITPLVILDNERIKSIYPGLAVAPFWATANQSICHLLHLFNTIAIEDSPYTSFDKADLETVLNSGVITFGATPIAKWIDATDISYAIRDNLRRNILAGGMDLSQGSVAACVVIGGALVLSKIPQENLEHGFEQLSRILGEGSTVHRGIYQGDKEGLVVYTAIGGLGAPEERLAEIARIGGLAEGRVADSSYGEDEIHGG